MRSIEGRNVVVVGGAGFIGSHVVDHLIDDRGCRVLVVDNLSSGRREFVRKEAEFHHADITGSERELLKLFRAFRAEFVLNYAAMPYIPVSFERPLHVFQLNAMGALQVINAAQEAGCEGILQVSSAEIYGEAGTRERTVEGEPTSEPVAIDETARVVPHSTYGAAKAAIDALIQVRWKESRTPCIALRQFNCLGERETHPYVIPEIVKQLSGWEDFRAGYVSTAHEDPPEPVRQEFFSRTQIVRLGNDSSRDFLYAGDAARMAVLLLERGSFGDVYNLGSSESIGIYDLARRIGRLMGFAGVDVVPDESRRRPWEIWHLLSDNRKILSAIGEHNGPQVELDEALRRTIKWFESNGNRWPWEE